MIHSIDDVLKPVTFRIRVRPKNASQSRIVFIIWTLNQLGLAGMVLLSNGFSAWGYVNCH